MRLAERWEGGRRRRKTTAASSWTGRERAFCSPLAVFVQIQVTSLYGGPLEFMFIVQSTEDHAYRAVSMLLSEVKDEVDAKIVVAGISTTCSQKIHNQLQKTLRRASRHNQFCQNCWRIPQPRSSSTVGSMSRVETAIAPTSAGVAIRLSRSLTDFINKIKADQNVLFDLSCKVHKYGKSTTGESWDIVVDEETYYEAELSIKPRERPPGVYPALDFGSSWPSVDETPDEFSPISCGSKNFVCVYTYFCALNNSNQIPLLLR